MPTAFENLEMGPCNITYKTTDLGLTKGGVEVEFATEVTPITVDQFGDTVVDNVIKGRSVKVKAPLAENDLAKLAACVPGSTLVGTTTKKLVINSAVGTSLRALAGELILHPKALPANDKSKDVTISLASVKGDFSFAFKHDDQKVFAVEFEGFVDLTSGELFIMGDPDATA
jgi:hypothetical protein